MQLTDAERSALNPPPPNTALCAIRLGNNEYYLDKHRLAIEYYNTAIVLAAHNPPFIVSVLINRAISKLRIQEYKKSILDCTLALSMQPNCIKAYICRAYGYFFTKEFKKAFSDHYIATNLTPPNIPLKRAMRISHGSSLLSLNSNTDQPHHYIVPKGVHLEWLSDFSLLSIEEETSRMHLLINYTNNQIEKTLKNKEKTGNTIPSLIPSGESFYGTTWSEFEEYHSQSKSNISESLSSKQKLLGNSDFQSKNYLSALGHYTKAIKLNPEYLEAITDCSISIEKQPLKAIKAYLRRGAGYSAIGDFWSAVKDFRTALKYEPESLEVLVGLSKTLRHIEQETKNKLLANPSDGQLAQSLKAITQEIFVLNSKIGSSKNDSLQKNRMQDDVSSANNSPSTANKTPATNSSSSSSSPTAAEPVKSSPKATRPSYYRPITKEQKDEQNLLIAYFTSIISKKIGLTPSAYLGRGEAYLQLGDFKNALEDYERGLEIDPKNPDLLKRYSLVISYVKCLDKQPL
eukprot:gene14787-17480_t